MDSVQAARDLLGSLDLGVINRLTRRRFQYGERPSSLISSSTAP